MIEASSTSTGREASRPFRAYPTRRTILHLMGGTALVAVRPPTSWAEPAPFELFFDVAAAGPAPSTA